MIDVSNLSKPRPAVWKKPLFEFIENGWNNTLAVAHNKNVVAMRLAEIDEIFDDAHKISAPDDIAHLLPAFLFMRSLSAFRASVMVGLCLPTDSYALQRSCLENAGYARLIADDPSRSSDWLKRNDTPESLQLVRDTFTQKKIKKSIETKDENLAAVYQSLYERCIDFGAHPNEKAVTLNVNKETLRTKSIQFVLMPGDGIALDHALRTAAQVGICSLKVFASIFNAQFETNGFSQRLSRVSQGF